MALGNVYIFFSLDCKSVYGPKEFKNTELNEASESYIFTREL